MRILHVITSADPKSGGTIEGVRQSGLGLRELGHEVEVLTADEPNSDFLRTFPLPIHAVGPAIGGFARASEMEPWLVQNAGRFDALVGNGIWQHPNLALRSAARRLGKPYWVFTHGMLDPWFNRAYPIKRVKKQLYWPWQYAVLRDAEAVLFTCEEERLLARQSFHPYKARERVVGYGTAEPGGEPESQKTAFAQAFPELGGQRYLLFLSRVHPKKGVDLLLKAFARLSDSDVSLHLAIAGPVDPAYRSDLVRIIAGSGAEARVHWLGMVQGDVKWGAFRSAEAFVLPSHQENFGIAVVEALACGTPVLITRPVNIWREIEEDGAGLVGEDTVHGVAELISKWQKTPPETAALFSEAARKCFSQRFTMESSAKRLLEVLEDGLANRRSHAHRR